jgi:hypothetical protein
MATDELKKQLDEVERWFDGDRKAAKAWQESLDAGGIIRADLVKIAAQIDGLLACGLTRECLIILIQARCPNGRNGKPTPKATIDEVLKALSSLKEFLVPQVQIKDTSLKQRGVVGR